MDEISILLPTYNRRKFLPFIIRNLKVQDYPHKNLQLVIYDDGDEPLIEDYTTFKNAIKPIKLKLLRNKQSNNKNRISIGEKRNHLIQKDRKSVV